MQVIGTKGHREEMVGTVKDKHYLIIPISKAEQMTDNCDTGCDKRRRLGEKEMDLREGETSD